MKGKLTPSGLALLAVAVGVIVGAAGSTPLVSKPPKTLERTIQWEFLEGEEGSDLMRLRTPDGWLVENADGFLVLVDDPEHEWLTENE